VWGYEPWASYIPSLLSNLQYEGNIGTSSYTSIHFFCTLRSVCINLCVHLKLERAICIPQSDLLRWGGEIARVLVGSRVNLSGVHT
jgi:hypothetical protein